MQLEYSSKVPLQYEVEIALHDCHVVHVKTFVISV